MAFPELLFVLPLVAILAWLSAVGGVGGGVLMLLVLTWRYGLPVAVPTLALTQLVSNGGRVWFNRAHVRWRLVGWYAVGAVPSGLAGGLLLAQVPAGLLKRVLGGLLIAIVLWQWLRPSPVRPAERSFAVVGGFTGLASSMLGAAGPIAAPFYLAYGLAGEAYIGTEAAGSLAGHLSKVAAYGTGNLLSGDVLGLAAALTPVVLLGAWAGKRTVQRMNARLFVVVIKVGIVLAGVTLLAGL
jgi:uncharacterized membrane protein YfcA